MWTARVETARVETCVPMDVLEPVPYSQTSYRRYSDVWMDGIGSKTYMGTQVSSRYVHNCGRRGFFFGVRSGRLIRVV